MVNDSRAPQSPHEARAEIARLRRKLESVTDLYEQAVMELAEAHAAWEAADDEAWVTVRRDWTPETPDKPLSKDWQTEVNRRTRKQRDEADGADRLVKRIEKTMRSLETQIGAAQSEAKSLQAELDHGHYGEGDGGRPSPQWSAPPRPLHPAEVAG